MRKNLLAWILACTGIGMAALSAQAGDGPRHRRESTRTVASEEARAWLGVSAEEETERKQGGARVTQVIDDSPAEKVGLEEGDVIVSLGGQAVYGPQGLSERIRSHEPGETVEVEIERDGKAQSLQVELGNREEARQFFWAPRAFSGFGWSADRPRLGVQLVGITPELREHLGGRGEGGVLVSKVMKGTPAERAGIRVGDLIEAVDGTAIEDAGNLIEIIGEHEGGVLKVDVVRDGQPMTIEVVLPDPAEDEPATGPRA